MNPKRIFAKWIVTLVASGAMLLSPLLAFAHCDSLDGPVVNDARAALESGDVTPVLKWVKAEQEGTIREAFAEAAKVRGMSPEAKSLADRFFFETLVRVHREGEGAGFTGLKPAGRIAPPVAKADQALATGSIEKFADTIAAHVKQAIHERFAHALAKKQKADTSVQAGREYVEAYVHYVHFIEEIAGTVHGENAH